MSDTNQVRINELARELEVKAKAIIDLLSEYGVTEKKTHSSSIPADVAEKVRKRIQGAAEAEAQAEAQAEAAVKAEKEAKDVAAKAARMKPAAPAAPPQASASRKTDCTRSARGDECDTCGTQGARSWPHSYAAGCKTRRTCSTSSRCVSSGPDSPVCTCEIANCPWRDETSRPGGHAAFCGAACGCRARRCSSTARSTDARRRTGSAFGHRKSRPAADRQW